MTTDKILAYVCVVDGYDGSHHVEFFKTARAREMFNKREEKISGYDMAGSYEIITQKTLDEAMSEEDVRKLDD